MKTALAKFGIVAMAVFPGVVWAQIPLVKPEFTPVPSNPPVIAPAEYPVNGFTPNNDAANPKSPEASAICPLIQMQDVPITAIIDHLARQATINYLIDPALLQKWAAPWEPTLSFKLTNATPKDVLERMLDVRGLALVEIPGTAIARIAPGDEPLPDMDSSVLDSEIGSSNLTANVMIPLIQFSDLPLDAALANLLQQCALRAEVAPSLKASNGLPLLNMRWEHLTARQAIIALCENYGLTVAKDETTGMLQIKPKEIKKHHHSQLK